MGRMACGWGWLAVAALVLVSPAAVAAMGIRVMGPGPLSVAEPSAFPHRGCRPVPTREGCTLLCTTVGPLRLTLVAPGYEPRTVELALAPGVSEIDLRDGGWTPTPVVFALDPPELAASVQAVWIEGDDLQTAAAADGVVLGPRVKPGEHVTVALVGSAVAPVVVSRQRAADGEPMAVQLESGSSLAMVCRDPWNGSLLSGCAVELGQPAEGLTKVGSATLLPHGRVLSSGPLLALELEDRSTVLIARAPEFPPTVREVAELPTVADVTLEVPGEVAIALSDETTGLPIAGVVRIAKVLREEEVLLATARSEPGAASEVVLAPGRYVVRADAPGFRPTTREITIAKPRTSLDIPLQRAARLQGRVVSDQGRPLAGAHVLALTTGLALESLQNVAQTDENGQFDVTLPGDGPWRVVAWVEGESSDAVAFAVPPKDVTLIVRTRCTVFVLPLFPDGTPVPAQVLAFLQPQGFRAVVATERSADGYFRAALAPGSWVAAVEELGLVGPLQLPEACEGWRGTVVLLQGRSGAR